MRLASPLARTISPSIAFFRLSIERLPFMTPAKSAAIDGRRTVRRLLFKDSMCLASSASAACLSSRRMASLRVFTSLSSTRRFARIASLRESMVSSTSDRLAVCERADFLTNSSSFSDFSQNFTAASALAKSWSFCRSVLMLSTNCRAKSLYTTRFELLTSPESTMDSDGSSVRASATTLGLASVTTWVDRSVMN
ncbi:hypothetical protein D3C76_1179320 [compost metagenome]